MMKWIVYVVTHGFSIVISLLTSGLVLIKIVYNVTGICKIIYTVNVLNIKDLSNISEKQRQKRQNQQTDFTWFGSVPASMGARSENLHHQKLKSLL